MCKLLRRLMSGVVVLAMFIASVGCTIKLGMFLPNSNFAYPNSNVEPLGRVTGSASKTTVFSAAIVDKEMLDTAYANALKQKGGDLLINYKLTTETTMIPIPFIPIFITELKVDGTAAKMTVGKQELK